MAGADALQNARMLLGHGLGPQVGNAGVQQVAGDDHRSLDAVADGHDGRVELGGVDLLDGQHIGHIGLNGGQMRGPTGHKLRVLVHCEHILTHLVEGGGHGPAETAQSDDQHAFVDAVFEACSAFSLGGYSVGVASAGNPASLFILSAEMIVGRLGPLTIAYSISRPMAPEPIRYPQENIIVG